MRSPSVSDPPDSRGARASLSGRPAVVLGGLLAALACLAWPRAAAADVKQECSAAYDQVQATRKAGKLVDARREAVVCARDACTDFIKADCGKWLGEIDASTPTVVFEVRDATGKETVEARVLLDGKELLSRLDGHAVPIDPGLHTLRYEVAGAAPIEDTVQIREGQKNRQLAVSFAPHAASAPLAPAAAASTTAPSTALAGSPPGQSSGGAPGWAFVVGAGGVVAGAVGVVLAATAKSGSAIAAEHPAATSTPSAPLCAAAFAVQCSNESKSSQTQLVVGGILGGVGAVALVVATVAIATAPPRSPGKKEALALRLLPTLGAQGAGASLVGSF